MQRTSRGIRNLAVLLAAGLGAVGCPVKADQPTATDPLPSWNDGRTKSEILEFVARVTDADGKDFVPVVERIATFDNDGTLWPEQPLIQALFVVAQLRARAAADPQLAARQPWKAALAGDEAYLARAGEATIMQLVAETSAGMTDEQYRAEVRRFFSKARHPTLGAPFTDLAYRPMLELMAFLRSRGFKVFICSGGGVDFLRVVSQQMYGVPPDQVIGTALEKEPRLQGSLTVLLRRPEIETINDKEGKPVNIDLHIGQRPLLAAGNVRSGGDIAMLRYSQVPSRPSLQLLINHDDIVREFGYSERDGASLEAAQAHGWLVVSMKDDWRIVFGNR
jgi:phosphoglycolate phosphatase-like HAD superfamily hydrolase